MLFYDYEPDRVMEETSIEMMRNSFDEAGFDIYNSDKKNTVKFNVSSKKNTMKHGPRIKVYLPNKTELNFPVNQTTGEVSILDNTKQKYPKESKDYLRLVTSYSNYAFKYIMKYYNDPTNKNADLMEDAAKSFSNLSKADRRKAYNGELKYED